MKRLSGPITDRLLRLFSPDDPVWTPQRGTPPPMPQPKGTTGQSIQGRKSRQ